LQVSSVAAVVSLCKVVRSLFGRMVSLCRQQ